MRAGQNPARYIEDVIQPAPITITLVNFIPYLSGFYEQSLQVLQASIDSLWENTPQAFDLLVFDNHSCPEVRNYLLEAHQKGLIQYLVLSEKNIGKMGAWNVMFGAAQGQYIVFCDADIYFRPGWLEKSLEIYEAFPNVGMVTGRPLRVPEEFCASTLAWGQQHGMMSSGQFMDWEVYWEHGISIGLPEEKARTLFHGGQDYRVTSNGVEALVGAGHFQFVSRRDVIQKILPIPSVQPMRGDRELDIAIDKLGFLRLTTIEPLVWHMGNRLPDIHKQQVVFPKPQNKLLHKIVRLPGIRHFLLWLHNQIFRLYFFNAE